MSYRRAVNFVDDLFKSFIIFVIVFIWFRYFLDSLALSLVLGVVTSLLISISLIALKKKKIDSINLSRKQQLELDDIATYLLLSNKNEILDIFNQTIMGAISGRYIIKDSKVYYPFFESEIFSLNDLYRVIKTLPENIELEIIAINFDTKVEKVSKSLKSNKIILTFKDQMYTKYLLDKKLDIKSKLSQSAKTTFKDFLRLFVRPENSKGYLFSAFYILLACLIIPQKLYYLIFASVLLVLALICRYKRQKA